ncbi:SMN2 [Branchiostoma lanceolatum]|uniref:SMN2 protein n=1 Tax=Branchiostoma lanceolatum TaxID=7740 RepID=A0A8J9ZEV0_BRALA|nr:SMN2 [Branchiostoma lanceolatum]
MASEGDVVFSREQVSCDEKDSDIWDDSALIQAYDKAVHAMKIALDNDEEIDDLKEEKGGSITTETDEKTEETDDKAEDRDNKAERNNEKNSVIDEKTNDKSVVEAEVSSSSMVRKKTKKRGKPKGSRQWMPGDQCIALYSEDQLWYPAEILSINPQRRTCLVRYTYYGNEEEQNLKDLSSLDQEGEFVQMYSGNTAVEGTSGSKKWSQYKNSEADGSPSRYESWWRDYHQKYGSYQPPPSQPHLPPPPSGQGHGSQPCHKKRNLQYAYHRGDLNEYHCLNGARNTSIRHDHEKYWTDQAAKLEAVAKRNDQRQIYSLLRQAKASPRQLEMLKVRAIPAIRSRRHPQQAGFLPNRFTTDPISALRLAIEKAWMFRKNRHLYIAFIDLRAAFDTVDHVSLWKILRLLGSPQKTITLFQ